jgi:hypothetical protein
MTTEYYQVEESANGGNFWGPRHIRETLEEAMAIVKMRRRRADGDFQYRIVKVTETREVVSESEPCPFCGGTVQTVSASTAIAGNRLYSVLCVCGAEGPTGHTPDEAAMNWSLREQPAKESEAKHEN